MGRPRKDIKKVRRTFSIDEKLYDEALLAVRDNKTFISALISDMLKSYIIENQYIKK